jgi:hypothetical protein
MFKIQISPEAKNAIEDQFRLLDLSEPALYFYCKPTSAEVTRSVDAEAFWEIDRRPIISLNFHDLLPNTFPVDHISYVDGIRICFLPLRLFEGIDIALSTIGDEIFIKAHNVACNIDPLGSVDLKAASLPISTGIRLGLIPMAEILDTLGKDRLRLFDISQGVGFDFHSLQWDVANTDAWGPKITITRSKFQGAHRFRRWISKLHSFSAKDGTAVINVAEGDRPIDHVGSCNYLYSWRVWDLQKNVEVEKLKDCSDPFEPLE